MQSTDPAYNLDNMNPTYATDSAPGDKEPSFERSDHLDPNNADVQKEETHRDVDGSQPTLRKVKNSLHDMKENVKEVFQRDHPHGQESGKVPQDGKTNPME